jgi:hypothetical protein
LSKCILFIDGESFLHKIEDVLKREGLDKNKEKLASVNLNNLFKDALKGINISQKKFYSAKIHLHPDTAKKSEELIRLQRKMRNSLVSQGYEYIIAGNVRGQKVGEIVAGSSGLCYVSSTLNR